MIDFTLHQDFKSTIQKYRFINLRNRNSIFKNRVKFASLENKKSMIQPLRFKNDVAQGDSGSRRKEIQRYREEHYYGHECERCGRKMGIFPFDHYYSLCKPCHELVTSTHDFVVRNLMANK